jgi:hypothetical protein
MGQLNLVAMAMEPSGCNGGLWATVYEEKNATQFHQVKVQ